MTFLCKSLFFPTVCWMRLSADYMKSIGNIYVMGLVGSKAEAIEIAKKVDFDYLIIAGYLKNETNYRVIEDLRKRHKRFLAVQWAKMTPYSLEEKRHNSHKTCRLQAACFQALHMNKSNWLTSKDVSISLLLLLILHGFRILQFRLLSEQVFLLRFLSWSAYVQSLGLFALS